MKTLTTLLLAFLCLGASAQLNVRLKPGGVYSPDSLGSTKLKPSNPKDYFKLSYYLTTNGYMPAKYNGITIFVDTSQIIHTERFEEYITSLIYEKRVYNPYHLTLRIDTANKTAYYQNIVKIDTAILIDELQNRVKQFIANNIAGALAQIENNKVVYTTIQNLFIPQGVGSMEFQVKYTMTIEIKQGKYRYTVNNIEIGYETLVIRHGKRETLYTEYFACNNGQQYDNHLKRIVSLEKHLKDIENVLYTVMSQKSKMTASDF